MERVKGKYLGRYHSVHNLYGPSSPLSLTDRKFWTGHLGEGTVGATLGFKGLLTMWYCLTAGFYIWVTCPNGDNSAHPRPGWVSMVGSPFQLWEGVGATLESTVLPSSNEGGPS